MRTSDLEGITYIRIVSLEQEAAAREAERFRDLWETDDRDGLPPPFRSVPIKVWALLKRGPLTAPELVAELRCTDASVRMAVRRLRKRGQRIVLLPARYKCPHKYQLLPGPPLKIIETSRGLTLLPSTGLVRASEVMIELR